MNRSSAGFSFSGAAFGWHQCESRMIDLRDATGAAELELPDTCASRSFLGILRGVVIIILEQITVDFWERKLYSICRIDMVVLLSHSMVVHWV